MAIRCELANDVGRGPGHGLIRIWGLPAGAETLEYSLERNQGSMPYLGADGSWQAQETWHLVAADTVAETAGGIEIRVGPEVVDPIVEQPQNVVCRLTLACGGAKHPGALKIQRPLLSSKAYTPLKEPVSAPRPVAEPVAQPDPDATVFPFHGTSSFAATPAPGPAVDLDTGGGKAVRIAAWLGVPALMLGVGGWLWWDCRLPFLLGPDCALPPGGEIVAPEPGLPKNCSGLAADACLAAALKGMEAGQLELGRQLLQEAGGLGAVKAYIHLARMYDPAAWTAEKSPVERADWETAAYWYDEAARTGDRDGMLGAGQLYCRNSEDVAFRSHGADLLRKALTAEPSDASAEQSLRECEEKLK